MMFNGESAVAGVPSERLSQLASPQLGRKPRREYPLAEHSAFVNGISEILRPRLTYDKKSDPSTPHPRTPKGYAGKSTCKINDSIYNHGSKKLLPEPNQSNQMTDLLSSNAENRGTERKCTRSLKQYFSPDQLSEAFCTKFHVTDPLTGRTEIMTARRPGRASAEVNVADFDAYMLPRVRTYSMRKAKDSIDHDLLGLMPKPNMEAKFTLGTTARQAQAPTLECKENWMIPTEHANVCKPLGLSRRRNVFPWTPGHTDNIAHVYDGVEASPRLTRSCIRPAFIYS